MVNNLTNCVDSNAGTDYAVLALESLVLNKGDEPKFSQQSIQKFDGGMCYAVSTTCSNIEAACRYLDWRFSEEGMMTLNYGIEGVTYEIVDDKVQLTDLVTKNEETPNVDGQGMRFPGTRTGQGLHLILLWHIQMHKRSGLLLGKRIWMSMYYLLSNIQRSSRQRFLLNGEILTVIVRRLF